MGRIKLILSYDGRNYCGFQRQKNGISVQEKLEDALKEIYCSDITVTASGRTDAGVSAAGQVVHFDCDDRIEVKKIPIALNTFLPNDISVISAKRVSADFNARFSAKKKTYVYKIYNSPVRNPLFPFCAHYPIKLDITLMKKAARFIEGEHDFKCFMASGSPVKDTVRTVYSVDIKKSGNIISIFVTGNGFLYNMVRIIAGTLVYAGSGKIAPESVQDIILSKDRKYAGKTMPPEGLCLVKVFYK